LVEAIAFLSYLFFILFYFILFHFLIVVYRYRPFHVIGCPIFA